MGDQWTNESVREFAQGKDPIAAIVDRARDAVFRAAADGWTGPPFDPLQLARLLGLEVVPLDTVTDARIVAGPSGSAIEYNPRRPRGRLRFSIAHEIAHSFFADAASTVRYRTGLGAVPDEDSDDWQLELLCNIAASELLMPNIALPIADIDSEPLDIDVIMQMRAQFDVSTEAILRRVVSGTTHQVACIATSRVSDRADEPSAFRVDYATASRTWSEPVARGEQIDSRSLASCTAVGFTSKSVDDLGERGAFHVQAVGTPAYPGRRYPRVLALVHPLDETRSDSTHLAYVTGNASEPLGLLSLRDRWPSPARCEGSRPCASHCRGGPGSRSARRTRVVG